MLRLRKKLSKKTIVNNIANRRNSDSGFAPIEMIVIISVVTIIFLFLLTTFKEVEKTMDNIADSATEVLNLSMDTDTPKNKSKYYTDELELITEPTKLEEGMRKFYDKTNIMPHLYITDSIENLSTPDSSTAEKWIDKKYDELFENDSHLLLVLLKNNEIDEVNWLKIGDNAKSVIDDKTTELLFNYIDRYSNNNIETRYSRAFANTAESIVIVEDDFWEDNRELFAKIGKIVLGIIIGGIVFGSVFFTIKTIITHKNKVIAMELHEYEEALKTINTPIDNIMEKYRKENSKINFIKHKDVDLEKLKEKYTMISKRNMWERS